MKALLNKARRWAVVQIPVGLVFLFAALLVREVVLGIARLAIGQQQLPGVWLGPGGSPTYGWVGASYGVWAAIVTILLGHLAYRSYVRRVETREPSELAAAGAVRECGAGALAGAGLVGLAVLLLWLLGVVEASRGNATAFVLIAAAALAASAAYLEELVVRGLFFRILEDRLGTWMALGISAVAFGLLQPETPEPPSGAAWPSRCPPASCWVRPSSPRAGCGSPSAFTSASI